jgi:membrane-associated phospholipid phosphatase
MNKRLQHVVRNISFTTALFAILFLICLVAFAAIAHEVVGENEDWFDTRAFSFLKGYSSPPVILFFKEITFLGSPWFLLPAYFILIIYLFLHQQRRDAINVAVIAITSTLLLFGLKLFFERHRPPLPLFHSVTTFSFPSGHALSSFIFCCVLISLIWKSRWRPAWKWIAAAFLIFLSLLIGISRIVLRYHFASDVVAGFCLGFAWVFLSFYVQRRLKIGDRA